MSKQLKVIIFQVILPLLIGVFIYATLREQPPFKHFIPWSLPVFNISFLPRFLFVFVVYRMPDMLWTFSFVSILNYYQRNLLLSSLIVISVVIIYEYFQYEGIINGTGDVGDIFYSLCSVIIYIIFFRGNNNEKAPQ